MTRINARIDPELAEKIERIRAATNASTTEIVRAALEAYYARFESDQRLAPHAVFEAEGFIGCADGEAELSSRYKEALACSLRTKLKIPDDASDRHDHR
ncbi:MAG: ribbon-helix-helix domain-containing protein [Myxococcota bacterium]